MSRKKDSEAFKEALEPEYSQIEDEIEPLVTRIVKVSGKTTPEYLQLKSNACMR